MCWELTGIWHGQRGCLQKKTPYLCRDGPKIAWSIKIDNSNYNLDRFSPFFYKYAWKCVETLTKWLFWRQFEKSLEFFAFFFLEWLFLCQFDIFSSKYFYEMSAVVWWCHKVWYDDFVMNEWNKWINILNALDISMNMNDLTEAHSEMSPIYFRKILFTSSWCRKLILIVIYQITQFSQT